MEKLVAQRPIIRVMDMHWFSDSKCDDHRLVSIWQATLNLMEKYKIGLEELKHFKEALFYIEQTVFLEYMREFEEKMEPLFIASKRNKPVLYYQPPAPTPNPQGENVYTITEADLLTLDDIPTDIVVIPPDLVAYWLAELEKGRRLAIESFPVASLVHSYLEVELEQTQCDLILKDKVFSQSDIVFTWITRTSLDKWTKLNQLKHLANTITKTKKRSDKEKNERLIIQALIGLLKMTKNNFNYAKNKLNVTVLTEEISKHLGERSPSISTIKTFITSYSGESNE